MGRARSERRKPFEQAAAQPERLILDGRPKPVGQLPPERDLQARFGVVHRSIREALIAPQRAGLNEIANSTRARAARRPPPRIC